MKTTAADFARRRRILRYHGRRGMMGSETGGSSEGATSAASPGATSTFPAPRSSFAAMVTIVGRVGARRRQPWVGFVTTPGNVAQPPVHPGGRVKRQVKALTMRLFGSFDPILAIAARVVHAGR